ncbi:MAG TPA: DUF433 domain-containing protein [Pyrinomonadaceae bacterium]|nr:DUF433 domain-containing protein [Pyrinomonadaceae bacterium]
MKDEELLARITIDPKVMVGKPVIKGTRLTVDFILNLLAHGATVAEITEEYDGLMEADIQACFLFATKALEDTSFVPLELEHA